MIFLSLVLSAQLIGGGSSGGGSGSGTVAGQTTNVVTVGGANSTTVKGSGCTVGGGSLDELTCKKFNSTGDATQSGVIDLKAKTSLNYYSHQAADTASPSVVEIAPISGPSATGQAKRIATRSTNQTVPYADGTKTDVTVAQMEWYTPQVLTGISNAVGTDSAVLNDSLGCTLSMDTVGAAPPESRLIYNCGTGSGGAGSFGVSSFVLTDTDNHSITFTSESFGWTASGFGLPTKVGAGLVSNFTANFGPTTVSSSGSFMLVRSYCYRSSGTGSAVLTLNWSDVGGSRSHAFNLDGTSGWGQTNLTINTSGNVTMSAVVTGTLNAVCIVRVHD